MRLKGKVAVVTGASRGVGRGIAIALGKEGATVYITGRGLDESTDAVGGSLRGTAKEIEEGGGEAMPVRVDHSVDEEVAALFAEIEKRHGHLDILVNNVFAIPSNLEGVFDKPFWQQPVGDWDTMHRVGLRSHYVASVYGAPLLLKGTLPGDGEHAGLIANISSFGGASYQVNVAYGVGKAGVDRLARDMAKDLRGHNVASVALYPGVVRTERVLAGQMPYSTEVSESPEFTGRAIAALALDEARMTRSGKVHVVAELARDYDFADVDGARPPSLRELAQKAREKKQG